MKALSGMKALGANGQSVAFALASVGLSLLLTAGLVALVGRDPLMAFRFVLEGAFGTSATFANVLNFLMPLALAVIGLVVTFRAGLWNIGVEAQLMAGAIGASYVALFVRGLPAPLWIVCAMIGGALAGMSVSLVIGWLKTRMGVNEIFGGVAMNALTNVYAIYLISGPWQPPEGGSAQATAPFPREVWLTPLSPEFPINLPYLLLVVGAMLAVSWLLQYSRWGLELKASGQNSRSAALLGVPTVRATFSALLVCGALAGLGGAHRVLETYHSLRPLTSGGIGFLGVLVVLLAGVRVFWAIAVAFGFGAILTGSTRLRIAMQMDSSLANVLQGLLVLSILLLNGVRERFFHHE
jgi:simple sugar transport system permease protein